MQSELKDLQVSELVDRPLCRQEIRDIGCIPQRFFEKMPIEAIESGLKKHFGMNVL